MTLPANEKILLHEYREGRFAEVELPFSAEYALTLNINGSPYVTMACSGKDLREHVTGYLITEGIISGADQIARLEVHEKDLAVDVFLMNDRIVAERLEQIKTISAAGEGPARGCPGRNWSARGCPGWGRRSSWGP